VNIPNVIVLITDGVPTRDDGQIYNEVRRVKDAGIRIVAVGITNAVCCVRFLAINF